MKRALSTILLAAMLLALSACGGGKARDMELTVFAAASMTETLTEIKTMYEKDHPGVTITYGSNVKEVATQVSAASVDFGVIDCTDAFSAGLTAVDSAAAGMCGQVIYPVSVLKDSQNAQAAQAFLDCLCAKRSP